jgi:excinuclease ABC subunit C
MLVEDQPKPDLILVDGGIHQLNAAKNILRSLDLTIPVAGMVKSQDHKTHHLIDMNDNELELDPRSKVFKLLSYIQEEAHRFAINYHKSLRAKGMYATILDNIDGVGEITKKKLLNHFKTISAMQQAPEEAFLELSIPKQTVKNIKAALNQTKNR